MFGPTCIYLALNRVLITVCDLEINPNYVQTTARGSTARALFVGGRTDLEETTMLKIMMRCAMVAILCTGASVLGYGQSATDGAVSGTITDSTGAALPAAKRHVHNDRTDAHAPLTAGARGS